MRVQTTRVQIVGMLTVGMLTVGAQLAREEGRKTAKSFAGKPRSHRDGNQLSSALYFSRRWLRIHTADRFKVAITSTSNNAVA